MKKIIKIFIKAAAFFLIFCVLFGIAQEILRYKFGEAMLDRYSSYVNEPEGSVDVVFIGSSSTYAGITPPVMWKECGVTAYNIGLSSSSSMISYYQLRYLLEIQRQKPKLVVFGFTRIGQDAKADDKEEFENTHRKAVQTMPSLKLKYEMILEIKKNNPNQDVLTYFFPILRFHSRWNEINRGDFSRLLSDTSYTGRYKKYTKGGYFRLATTDYEVMCHEELFEADIDPVDISEYSLGYYKQIFKLCAENGIDIAVVSYPRRNDEGWIGIFKALDQVCSENGVRYYNLSTPENWEALGIDGTTDFYDTGHVNAGGATKVSRGLARLLQEDFDLPDHRGDAAYKSWEDDWNAFYEDYHEVLAEFGY